MEELKERTIEKEFVPYEIALKLKELGFKNNYNFKEYDTYGYLQHTGLLESHKLEAIDAPLWQQAFDWFLNRGYFADIKPDLIVTSLWSYRVVDINGKYNPENLHCYRFTYYRDARLECLKKLIEIDKEQNVK